MKLYKKFWPCGPTGTIRISLQPGDILVVPAERNQYYVPRSSRVRVSASTLSKWGLSVGSTSRADNSADAVLRAFSPDDARGTALAVFGTGPGERATAAVVPVACEPSFRAEPFGVGELLAAVPDLADAAMFAAARNAEVRSRMAAIASLCGESGDEVLGTVDRAFGDDAWRTRRPNAGTIVLTNKFADTIARKNASLVRLSPEGAVAMARAVLSAALRRRSDELEETIQRCREDLSRLETVRGTASASAPADAGAAVVLALVSALK